MCVNVSVQPFAQMVNVSISISTAIRSNGLMCQYSHWVQSGVIINTIEKVEYSMMEHNECRDYDYKEVQKLICNTYL